MLDGVEQRKRPECDAGGFSRNSGAVQFYQRVNALLRPDMTVLDLGAGRGAFTDTEAAYTQRLQTMKGKVAKVIGMDIDPVVMTNPHLDEAYVIADNRLPVPANSVDLIVSDWTFEHIDEPKSLAAEIDRILKPGGWICARTPSKWSPVSFAARMVPNTLHAKVLEAVQPGRQAQDVFPTRYRMNSNHDLKAVFPEAEWAHHSYRWRGDPHYHFENDLVWWAIEAASAFMPEPTRHTLLVFIQKREQVEH
jgi:SAM-dependent methyltransferase